MDIQFSDMAAAAAADESGNLAILVFQDEPLAGSAAELDQACGGSVSRLLADAAFRAAADDTATLPHPQGISARALVVAGLGLRAELSATVLRRAGGAVAAAFGKRGGTILLHGLLDKGATARVAEIALGAGLRSYRFERHKTEAGRAKDAPPEPDAGPVVLALAGADVAKAAFVPRAAALAGVALARDLVNEPANVLGTAEFAEQLQTLEADGVAVEILGEKELEALGMRTLLAVGRGSVQESRVGVLRWRGLADREATPLALIGKGVVFDTGGISIKPAKGMEEMTMDMGGAAVVAGVMRALARRKARANVVGLVGLVENMPGGNAQRPGDVVTSMAGKTVEVINTDAEGRLVLADVMHYAQERFAPSAIIDLATLTGAMMVSLGLVNAGFFANDDELAAALAAAAAEEDEGLWRMPLGEKYAKELRSDIADLKNVSDSPWGGAVTAAEFLHAFIRPGQSWAHIDIAGVTVQKSNQALSPKGATGWGVRTLDRLVSARYEDK